MNVLQFPTDIERVCECCGDRAAIRGDYCLTCEAAVINQMRAELCDIDESLSGDDVDAFAAEQMRPSIAPLAPEAA
jgi:hypothetical protein